MGYWGCVFKPRWHCMQCNLPNLWYACDQNILQQERFLTPVAYGFIKNDNNCIPVPIFRNCDQPSPIINAYSNKFSTCSYPEHPIVAEWQPQEQRCYSPSPCVTPTNPCHDVKDCQKPPKPIHCTAVTTDHEVPCTVFKSPAKERCCPEKVECKCKCPQTTYVCQEVPSRTMKQPCCNICKFIFPPCREYLTKSQPKSTSERKKPLVWHYFKTSSC